MLVLQKGLTPTWSLTHSLPSEENKRVRMRSLFSFCRICFLSSDRDRKFFVCSNRTRESVFSGRYLRVSLIWQTPRLGNSVIPIGWLNPILILFSPPAGTTKQAIVLIHLPAGREWFSSDNLCLYVVNKMLHRVGIYSSSHWNNVAKSILIMRPAPKKSTSSLKRTLGEKHL